MFDCGVVGQRLGIWTALREMENSLHLSQRTPSLKAIKTARKKISALEENNILKDPVISSWAWSSVFA